MTQLLVEAGFIDTDQVVGAGRLAERTQRISTLLDLDMVLSAAANRYNLAAQIVHHGWPHRAD